MISRTNTLPRGAVFLSDANGGHWWVSDQLLGICELMPQNIAGQPPFVPQNCNGTPKSGGQVVVGDPSPSLAPPLPAGSKFVYVADASTKSVKVVRFVFNPAGNGGFTGSTQITVTNPTFVGGGSGGGRVVGLALTPHNGPAANGGKQDLYVGYLKSGDVMRVEGIDAVALNNPNPPALAVGSTSDGKGVNSFVMFGNDLYLGETGGFGVSKIADPSGITRSACSAISPCTAVSLNPNPSFLAGGMATDWIPGSPTAGKAIFIGDGPRVGAAHSILRYDPATFSTSTYSLNINPGYTEPDSNGVATTWATYVGPLGLGYNAVTGELFVGDDPQFLAATPVLQQGHIWKVPPPAAAAPPTVISIFPNSGTTLGGTAVSITGSNFSTTPGATTINFGANAATGVFCAITTSCNAISPAGNSGVIDVRVTVAGGTSAASPADWFTYVAPASNAITIASVTPNSGATTGGTLVTITGTNLIDAVSGLPYPINFGVNLATSLTCASAISCTATVPAGTVGVVDVQATDPASGLASPIVPGDKFTYIAPVASLFAWGITAPKGGAVWLPGNLGGHWWSSDHAQGMCRQDPMSTAVAPFALASTLHAINYLTCASDLVGSAGQAVYDPRTVVNLATGAATTLHYVYVPDNAVKSTAVWRLTFDPATETMVADPNGGALATAMTSLADVRTLKPNGMALGPDGNLYVTDLVEPNVRQITNPNGDPRTQTISIVAVTGDGRGANGTQGFIGNLLYISGNRATQFFDITKCPLAGGPCGMESVPAPLAAFVAGTATDPVHQLVYLSNSPGGGPASIIKYDASKDVYVPFPAGSITPDLFGVVHGPGTTGAQGVIYITGGLLPALPPATLEGTVTSSLTGQRPWDQTNHSTVGIAAGSPVPTAFAFVFGLGIDPTGTLAITEDPSAGNRSGRGTMWTVPYIP